MKKINLHNLIVSLQKKKIDLGPNPKETISMYSELGLIPPAKFKVLDSDASSPEILYPVDTLQKIIEIKKLKKKGLEIDEIRDTYALDYVKNSIQEMLATQDKGKLKELAKVLTAGSDQLSAALEAPLVRVIETKNSKELSKIMSLFAGQGFTALLKSNEYLEKYNVNEARKSLFKAIFYITVICLKLARTSKDKALEDSAFETYDSMVVGPIKMASKKVQSEFRSSLDSYMKSKKKSSST
jgi:hypothetical protein